MKHKGGIAYEERIKNIIYNVYHTYSVRNFSEQSNITASHGH